MTRFKIEPNPAISDVGVTARPMSLTQSWKGNQKMNGYGMGFGGFWMPLVLALVVLEIAALVKYLWK